MTTAMIWKEWREQRILLAVLLTVGVGVIMAAAELDDHPGGSPWRGGIWQEAGVRETTPILFIAVAAIVVGASLLAGEGEAGTLPFLDRLPVSRWAIWRAKVIAGAMLTLVPVGVYGVVGWFVAFGSDPPPAEEWAVIVAVIGGTAYIWGVLGSAFAKSTLGAAGWAVLGLPLSALCLGVFQANDRLDEILLPILITLYLGGFALLISGFRFAGLGRSRKEKRSNLQTGKRPRLGYLALLWLTAKQARGLSLTLAAVGLLVGGLLMIPRVPVLLVWPGFTLLVGVICGVAVTGPERSRETVRFWAERRLPLGRLWWVRAVFFFALMAGVGLLALVPGVGYLWVDSLDSSLEHEGWSLLAQVFRSDLFRHLESDRGTILWFGGIYGFAGGLLAGVLFRKTLIAGIVGLVTSAMLASLWVPSLVMGGVDAWQIFAAPVLLLLTSRLLMWPWATGRLTSLRGIATLTGGVTASVLALAGGIAYRVGEIPDVPDPLAASGYLELLPSPEKNHAGGLARQVLAEHQQKWEELTARYHDLEDGTVLGYGSEMAESILNEGWPDDAAIDPLMDELFAGDWDDRLAELPHLPPGVIDDPQQGHLFGPRYGHWGQELVVSLCMRGLQLQALGHPEAFPPFLEQGLALARMSRYFSDTFGAYISFTQERLLFQGLNRWLEGLSGRPDLLAQTLEILKAHDQATAKEPGLYERADELIARNYSLNPHLWMEIEVFQGQDPNGIDELEQKLVLLAWQVPWEQMRVDRINRYALTLNRDEWSQVEEFARTDHPFAARSQMILRSYPEVHRGFAGNLYPSELSLLRRVALLKVALRLYDAEGGEPAESLGELVPDYLTEVPIDPDTGQPFQYAVSVGEPIAIGPFTLPLPAGQGVLWLASVSTDVEGVGMMDSLGPGSLESELGISIFPVPMPGGWTPPQIDLMEDFEP